MFGNAAGIILSGELLKKIPRLRKRETSAGWMNFDERSFDINDESNMNVLDAAFTARMIADFERDKAQCKTMTLADVKGAPRYKRSFEWFTGLFRQQL